MPFLTREEIRVAVMGRYAHSPMGYVAHRLAVSHTEAVELLDEIKAALSWQPEDDNAKRSALKDMDECLRHLRFARDSLADP